MDIYKAFIDELRVVIRQEINDSLEELIKRYAEDKWMTRKELAEYWGVSVSYIDHKIDEIPHSVTTPVAFKKSQVDAWRMGELKNQEIVNSSKVNINNYKKNDFKVGR
ncbi:helix-turn-helix transcriptional regulator [Cellulosilyticum sp. WCF-2]|uniref:helix-turn-helix transcriptional regulator n=1 Tax=Cellulosilyticum sp. WCF-2 TaxID=2497860 RepID=UPI000F8E5F07|nr:hypothetical protein [Cellulosilyticum sp. WCF-2]QEH68690.1 hypothetical protein EKH84_09995 [Cellulosilyticum sp. WCF-2]